MSEFDLKIEKKEPPRLVVRLSSSLYPTKRGFAEKFTVDILKRKSLLEDGLVECLMMDVCDLDGFDVEWRKYKPGVYELQMTGIYRDWETGCVEEWEWDLVPYEENTDETSN